MLLSRKAFAGSPADRVAPRAAASKLRPVYTNRSICVRTRAEARSSSGTAVVDAGTPSSPRLTGEARSHETDVVIIGSGIGGLCAGAMLAKYGYKVRWQQGICVNSHTWHE